MLAPAPWTLRSSPLSIEHATATPQDARTASDQSASTRGRPCPTPMTRCRCTLSRVDREVVEEDLAARAVRAEGGHLCGKELEIRRRQLELPLRILNRRGVR